MRFGNIVGLAAVMTSVIGAILMLVFQGSVQAVEAGGVLQLLASGMMIFAVIRSSWRWFLMLPFLAAAAFLWLLAQGH